MATQTRRESKRIEPAVPGTLKKNNTRHLLSGRAVASSRSPAAVFGSGGSFVHRHAAGTEKAANQIQVFPVWTLLKFHVPSLPPEKEDLQLCPALASYCTVRRRWCVRSESKQEPRCHVGRDGHQSDPVSPHCHAARSDSVS